MTYSRISPESSTRFNYQSTKESRKAVSRVRPKRKLYTDTHTHTTSSTQGGLTSYTRDNTRRMSSWSTSSRTHRGSSPTDLLSDATTDMSIAARRHPLVYSLPRFPQPHCFIAFGHPSPRSLPLSSRQPSQPYVHILATPRHSHLSAEPTFASIERASQHGMRSSKLHTILPTPACNIGSVEAERSHRRTQLREITVLLRSIHCVRRLLVVLLAPNLEADDQIWHRPLRARAG